MIGTNFVFHLLFLLSIMLLGRPSHTGVGNLTRSRFVLNDKICSTIFGKLGSETCEGTRIKLAAFSRDVFFSVLEKEDTNSLVRQIHLHVPTNAEALSTLLIGHTLDEFLAPRPWWIVVKEHHVNYVSQQKQLSNETNYDAAGSYNAFLLRQHQLFEPRLHMLAKVQFPPTETCKKSRLMIGHLVNSGWGSHLNFYGLVFGGKPWTIFNVWDSNTNDLKEGVAYASASTCPALVNKRLCAFLPLTNCTMPSYLTNATSSEMKTRWPEGSFLAYTSASEDGVPGPRDDARDQQPQDDYQRESAELYNKFPDPNFQTSKFLDGNGIEGSRQPDMNAFIPSYGLILRPNALYRSLIQKRIEEFRHEENFPPHISCVALHIRRGDRVLKLGPEQTEQFCKAHTKPHTNECTNLEKTDVPCSTISDMGCFFLHGFGALRLQDYLDKASLLLNTTNVFVMTDDYNWLMEEKKTIASTWKVATLAARPGVDARLHDSPIATSNGVDFLAAMAVARQCSAFVGHWGSAVTHVMYNVMCYNHGTSVGHCPPTCDMGANFRG